MTTPARLTIFVFLLILFVLSFSLGLHFAGADGHVRAASLQFQDRLARLQQAQVGIAFVTINGSSYYAPIIELGDDYVCIGKPGVITSCAPLDKITMISQQQDIPSVGGQR